MPFMPQIRPAGSHDPADRDERDHALRLGASGCRTVMASGRMSGSTIGLDIAKSVFQVVAPTWLSSVRTALPLPSAHTIRCPFIEIARSHDCLYPGEPHIVSDGVAHARESNADTPALQLFDET